MNETPTANGSKLTIIACMLGVLLVVLVGLSVLRDRLRSEMHESARTLATAQEKLATQMDNLKRSVDALGSQPQPDGAASAALDSKLKDMDAAMLALGTRINGLEESIAENHAQPVVAPAAPVPASAQNVPAALTPPASAFMALKAAALGGKPFATELNLWESQHPHAPEASALRSFAETGIPTEIELIRQLREVLTAQDAAPVVDDVSVIGKINTHLAGLVSIKKSGNADAYASIRRALERDDIAALMQTVEALDEPARAPLAAWLKTATARRDAITILSAPEPESSH